MLGGGRSATDQSQARAATGNWQPRRQSCVKRQRRAERAASGTRAAFGGRFGGIGPCLEHRSKLQQLALPLTSFEVWAMRRRSAAFTRQTWASRMIGHLPWRTVLVSIADRIACHIIVYRS